jgi:diketogulonate reductase-like aldo/keto reductase
MILEETYTLSNGINIPKIGLGTWFINNKKASNNEAFLFQL